MPAYFLYSALLLTGANGAGNRVPFVTDALNIHLTPSRAAMNLMQSLFRTEVINWIIFDCVIMDAFQMAPLYVLLPVHYFRPVVVHCVGNRVPFWDPDTISLSEREERAHRVHTSHCMIIGLHCSRQHRPAMSHPTSNRKGRTVM